jgi:hypothetical protein
LNLFVGEGAVIRGIVSHVRLLLEREGVIYVDKQILKKEKKRRNPNDEGHERNPDPKRCAITKVVAPVDEPGTVDGYDLLELVERVEWHPPISERYVGLEENESDVAVCTPVLEESPAKVLQSVEAAAGDGVPRDHGIEREVTSTVIDHETQVGGVRLRNGMDRHAVHARQEVRAKCSGESAGDDFGVAL